MTTKGLTLTDNTKQNISLAKRKDRTLLTKLAIEYLQGFETGSDTMPTVSGLCLSMGITESTLLDAITQSDDIKTVYDFVKLLQQDYLITRGIKGSVNSRFASFLLKAKHGFTDTLPPMTQTNNFNISPDLLADALKLMHQTEKKD